MSYDSNVYVGYYIKVVLKPGHGKLFFLFDEQDDAEIRYQTDGRAGLAEVSRFKGMHYVCPEFMPDNDRFAYILLPGYTKLTDVGRSDSLAVPHGVQEFPAAVTPDVVDLLIKVFNFTSSSIHFGTIIEVV